MYQSLMKIRSKMPSSILESIGDNYVVLIIIANNGTESNLAASGIPGCVRLPCLWVKGRAGAGGCDEA